MARKVTTFSFSTQIFKRLWPILSLFWPEIICRKAETLLYYNVRGLSETIPGFMLSVNAQKPCPRSAV